MSIHQMFIDVNALRTGLASSSRLNAFFKDSHLVMVHGKLLAGFRLPPVSRVAQTNARHFSVFK